VSLHRIFVEVSDMPLNSLLVGLEEVRRHWLWFLVLGIALVVLGVLAITMAWLAALTLVLFLGFLLIVSGVFELVHAFYARGWSGFFLDLLLAVLDIVVGVLLVLRPELSVAVLTLLLAVFLLVGGLFRTVAAVMLRFPSWGWAVAGGVVTVLLGVLILVEWPESALWVLGTFLGIDLMLRGWMWIMLAITARQAPPLTPAPPA
jgi:uncharacterized membrane protein HdeD (DUF308 family)